MSSAPVLTGISPSPLASPLFGYALVTFERAQGGPKHPVEWGLKRLVDIAAACVGLLVLSPLLLLLALAIQIDNPGPVFYRSLRIGQHYRPFYMLKFRTMRTDADRLRDQLRQQAGLQGSLFKIKDDPRVTRLGRLLRAFSLDELPQLFNVLLGDMSLVGPRPLPPDESDYFRPPYTRRFQVLPGMTGRWQVSGRSALDFEALCRLEYQYVSSWTLLEDFKILFQTLPAVFKSRGAY